MDQSFTAGRKVSEQSPAFLSPQIYTKRVARLPAAAAPSAFFGISDSTPTPKAAKRKLFYSRHPKLFSSASSVALDGRNFYMCSTGLTSAARSMSESRPEQKRTKAHFGVDLTTALSLCMRTIALANRAKCRLTEHRLFRFSPFFILIRYDHLCTRFHFPAKLLCKNIGKNIQLSLQSFKPISCRDGKNN